MNRRTALPASVALVHDALPCRGGAERTVETMLELFPRAPLYTLVHDEDAFAGTPLHGHEIHTSFVNRLPGVRSHYRRYLPLFPWAVERFDLDGHDLILSSSYAVAHGVVPRPDQLHVSYRYTPLRQVWQHHHEYLRSLPSWKAWLAGPFLHYVRLWDVAAAARVDRFVAISRWVADCIWRAYRRRAVVIYPPVEVESFEPGALREDYYITVARLAPHKRLDLVLAAFSRLDRPLLVVGDGAEYSRLEERAPPNVRLLGRRSDREVAELLGRARAFIHAAEEDFGITLVEAQAAGCPVIAYGRGGAAETVVHGRTGLLFPHQTVEALMAAVRQFEDDEGAFAVRDLRHHAQQFSRERFKRQLRTLLGREWERFRRRGSGGPSRSPNAVETTPPCKQEPQQPGPFREPDRSRPPVNLTGTEAGG